MLLKFLSTVIFSILFSFSSQAGKVDSLLKIANSDVEIDTTLEAYFLIVEHYFFKDNDSSEYYANILIEKSVKNRRPHYAGVGHHFIGLIYFYGENMAKTLEHYYPALDYYKMANDSSNASMLYSALGNLYTNMKDYEKALSLYKEAFDWMDKNDKKQLSYYYHNIAIAYKNLDEFDTAKNYYDQSIKLKEELGDTAGIAITYNNIGVLYELQDDWENAEKYYALSAELKRKIGDTYSLAYSLSNLGKIYVKTDRVRKGLSLCHEAYDIFDSFDFGQKDIETCLCLYEGYSRLNDAENALKYYQEYIAAKDSLFSYEKTKELVAQESKNEYEKKRFQDSLETAKVDAIQEAEIAKGNAELANKRKEQFILYGGIGAMLIIALILFNRFRASQKQKQIIQNQKLQVDQALTELETKNEEITDSITYAKRIQSAILPPDEVFFNQLKNSFVLYRPKDIVAGDFYWMEVQKERVLFAAADCTGHGVPGAMVSVFCSNGLNRSVREHHLSEPGEILNMTREIVVREFEKSEDNVKDGMDIALCSLEGNTLKYAGAHNPLWIIRKDGTEIKEIKADKQPIGKFANSKPYHTHEVKLTEGDTFYIFSDGYADQFGGEKGKKFKASNFKKLLLEIQQHPIQEHKDILDKAFLKWKGSLEQLDDVCVIGVRI